MKNLNIKTLTLVNNSTYTLKSGEVRRLEIPDHYEGCYATNNGICAVLSEGMLYVFPFYMRALRVLENEFKENIFFVPFSNGEIPADENLWNELRAIQRRENELEFARKCTTYSTQHIRCKRLPEEVLAQCMKLPFDGFAAKDFLGNPTRMITPINSYRFDSFVQKVLWRWNSNNGVTIFVHTDGTMYLSPLFEVREAVEKYGLKKVNMPVPLSNGETPTEPTLAQQWEYLLSLKH